MGLFDKLFGNDEPSLEESQRIADETKARRDAAIDAFNAKARAKFGDNWEDIQ